MGYSEGTERTDAQEEIMSATYEALCEHGYAALTIERIASELGKSTAAIHYHYETKDELLVAFLEYLLDRIDEWIDTKPDAEPRERLAGLLDGLLPEEPHDRQFTVALLEMRAQAPYNEAFREQFVGHDERTRELLESAIEDGVEAGVFEGDAADAARSLMALVDGGWTRYVVLGDGEALTDARATAREYVEAVLSA